MGSESAWRSARIQRWAAGLGLDWLGIAPAEPAERPEFLKAWLQAGRQGQMDYLADPKRVEQMLDVTLRMPGAKSVICVALPHQVGEESKVQGPMSKVQGSEGGRIARYAWMADYHQQLKKKLHRLADELRGAWPEHQFVSTVDTAAVLEREHAARAGLGWIGKNTMLIHPQRGSWFLLGEIITTLKLQTAADLGQTQTDHCGGCTACLEACPTQCLKPYEIDASRCVSYLTIEHEGPIDESLQPAMGNWLAGCDVCQEVCPFNRLTGQDQKPRGEGEPSLPRSLSILEVMNWSESDRRQAVRLSALKRIKLDQFRRNAIIAAGNVLQTQDIPAWRKRLEEIACDSREPQVIRQTAGQALARLQK